MESVDGGRRGEKEGEVEGGREGQGFRLRGGRGGEGCVDGGDNGTYWFVVSFHCADMAYFLHERNDHYFPPSEPPDLGAGNALILRQGCSVEHVVSGYAHGCLRSWEHQAPYHGPATCLHPTTW